MRITLFILFFLLIEWYSYVVFASTVRNKNLHYGYIAINVLVISFFAYSFLTADWSKGQNPKTMYLVGLILLIYIPKTLVTFLFLLQDVIRLTIAIYLKIFTSSDIFFPERRRFVTQISLGLAAIPFLSLLYGMVKGKYNFRVHTSQIKFDDLPEAFDGFKILQISDLHCGSFDNKEKIQYGIDLINEQNVDLIVFTGDLVNTLAEEVDPWISVLSKIKKPEYGKYSVLGNHDYGEYIQFDSEAAKEENFAAIKNQHSKIGFDLLLNQNVRIEKDQEALHLVGVENWGLRFKKAGDLTKASGGLSKEDFKILLSHDPSHWDAEVVGNPLQYHLTLSGHTHGMQFGIEIPGWMKWSPVQYVYEQWAGLYQKGKNFLYVNRGFGFHAYPGRVGILPEITVLELKKS